MRRGLYRLNSTVFSCRLIALNCISSRRSARKLIHTRGPATEKLLSPKVLWVRGRKHVLSVAERRFWRPRSTASWMCDICWQWCISSSVCSLVSCSVSWLILFTTIDNTYSSFTMLIITGLRLSSCLCVTRRWLNNSAVGFCQIVALVLVVTAPCLCKHSLGSHNYVRPVSCDKTKETCYRSTVVGRRRPIPCKTLAQSDPPPSRNAFYIFLLSKSHPSLAMISRPSVTSNRQSTTCLPTSSRLLCQWPISPSNDDLEFTGFLWIKMSICRVCYRVFMLKR